MDRSSTVVGRSASRRPLAGALALASLAATAGGASGCSDHVSTVELGPDPEITYPVALEQLGHLVVIYLENHSFDSLYGSFPGAEGLASPAAAIPQIDDTTGQPYPTLPQTDPSVPLGLPNAPFDITRFVPVSRATRDLVHAFYQEQQQIDGGRMDRFVTISDAQGLTVGNYPTAMLPLAALAAAHPARFTLCDHFFHAAFGGSFLNHQWLVAARTPEFPDAPAAWVASVDTDGALLSDGTVTPDGFAVNTVNSVNSPHPAGAAPEQLLPEQTAPTIGDRLSQAGVDWAWYAAGWDDALAGSPASGFQFHHQPLAYFATFADGTAQRGAHLKDEADLRAGIDAGLLPAVSFFKPMTPENEHPGGATDLLTGEAYTVALVRRLMASPLWNDMVIIVTYDENGGFWDHVPPPVSDRWGPGTRIPALVFSPFARGGVDATPYDTTAILALIEKRWHLAPLGARDAAQNDLSSHALRFLP